MEVNIEVNTKRKPSKDQVAADPGCSVLFDSTVAATNCFQKVYILVWVYILVFLRLPRTVLKRSDWVISSSSSSLTMALKIGVTQMVCVTYLNPASYLRLLEMDAVIPHYVDRFKPAFGDHVVSARSFFSATRQARSQTQEGETKTHTRWRLMSTFPCFIKFQAIYKCIETWENTKRHVFASASVNLWWPSELSSIKIFYILKINICNT